MSNKLLILLPYAPDFWAAGPLDRGNNRSASARISNFCISGKLRGNAAGGAALRRSICFGHSAGKAMPQPPLRPRRGNRVPVAVLLSKRAFSEAGRAKDGETAL